MRYMRSSLTALWAVTAAASTAFAQSLEASSRPRSPSTSSGVAPTSIIYLPSPTQTVESGAYYPNGGGSNDDSMLPQGSDSEGGGAGRSTAFMGGALGAQIGIIATIVVLAIAMFVGIIVYYFHRRKQWEREVKRRSALPPNAKLVVDKKTGEVRLADRSSTASQVGLAELEKGGHKVAQIEGEVKPSFFKMLMGKF